MAEEKITKKEIEEAKKKLKEKKEQIINRTSSEKDGSSSSIKQKSASDKNKKADISDKKEFNEKEAPKKKEKKERIGMLNIYTTFNNTIINLTDLAGTSIAKFSGGGSTKQDRLKANPTVAMFVAQKIAEEAKDHGFTGFYVKIRAATGQANPGPGAHAAIKSLTRAGFKILSIMDSTRIPRGGPKRKGGRRGRRV